MRAITHLCAIPNLFPHIFAVLMMSAGIASAKIDACQPNGMSDAEAARIIAIAKEHGSNFRRALNAARDRGIILETDTTYDEIMADPERALALAKEYSAPPLGGEAISGKLEARLADGEKMDDILRDQLHWRIKKYNSNYFSLELGTHLQGLALAIGGAEINSPHRFSIHPNVYILALTHFAKTAGFVSYAGGNIGTKLGGIMRFRFVESLVIFRDEPLQLRLEISTNYEHTLTAIGPASFHASNKPAVIARYFTDNRLYCLTQFTNMFHPYQTP